MKSVIPPKLAISLKHKTYDDKFMSYIYSSDFQLQKELLAVLNNVVLHYINITPFSVLPGIS